MQAHAARHCACDQRQGRLRIAQGGRRKLLRERGAAVPVVGDADIAASRNRVAVRVEGAAGGGLAAGADAYLNKPIDFAALAQLMQQVSGGRGSVSAAAECDETAAAA